METIQTTTVTQTIPTTIITPTTQITTTTTTITQETTYEDHQEEPVAQSVRLTPTKGDRARRMFRKESVHEIPAEALELEAMTEQQEEEILHPRKPNLNILEVDSLFTPVKMQEMEINLDRKLAGGIRRLKYDSIPTPIGLYAGQVDKLHQSSQRFNQVMETNAQFLRDDFTQVKTMLASVEIKPAWSNALKSRIQEITPESPRIPALSVPDPQAEITGRVPQDVANAKSWMIESETEKRKQAKYPFWLFSFSKARFMVLVLLLLVVSMAFWYFFFSRVTVPLAKETLHVLSMPLPDAGQSHPPPSEALVKVEL
eukprot:TRINITY_DN17163_c0_g1_i1.p1 TRINITY_DN17163_c0_g1~~TRINITY_DN17163_c0_g1_i1.p1  ORF type:complete len:314 (-),score=58.10 TRINITY_DN17163_c0_g1_i1:8-949(-)